MDFPESLEVVLIIEASEESVSDDLNDIFGSENVSSAKRAIGGFEIKAFFKPTLELVGKALGSIFEHRESIRRGKLVIGKDQISLENFGKEDALSLLESPAVQRAIDTYQGKEESEQQ